MTEITQAHVKAVQGYADAILKALPPPPVSPAGSTLLPGLAYATVFLLWASSKEDPRTMYATMKAYHELLRQLHRECLAGQQRDRKAKEGKTDG